MQLTHPIAREYRTWFEDSRRWSEYTPRDGDIVIATYPKCGTTWMQRIVASLVFQTPEPVVISEVSPWIDRRLGLSGEELRAFIEAQEHRRFFKSHVPYDGLPIYDRVKYIHVARDGRDAAFSWHNHCLGMRPEFLDAIDARAIADETLGKPLPRTLADPADEFHRWLTVGAISGSEDGLPNTSYFDFEKGWWEARHQDNILMVHFNDLKSDLAGEIARIAEFLEIDVAPDLMPRLVEAATFSAMKRNARSLLPQFATTFDRGPERFLHKGTNRRWQGIYRQADLALYQEKLAETLPEDCIAWLAHGGPAI